MRVSDKSRNCDGYYLWFGVSPIRKLIFGEIHEIRLVLLILPYSARRSKIMQRIYKIFLILKVSKDSYEVNSIYQFFPINITIKS